MASSGFGIRGFGCDIAVIVDCEQALATLQRYLLPSLPRIAPDVGAEIVLHAARYGIGFDLVCDGLQESTRDLAGLVTAAVRLLDEAIIKHLTSLTAVHAGVVELAGRALLLPGRTHAGKSALVAELLRHGAAYLSDEYALIDVQGQVHPYARPLLLRNGGHEQIPVLPQHWNATVGNERIPVGWILALQYDPASAWRLAPVSQSEGLLILLQNTPHSLRSEPRILAALLRASATSECYTGLRNNATDAVRHILRLVRD